MPSRVTSAVCASRADTYVDGGVISATNADVLRRDRLDLVVVVSPMTGRTKGRSVNGAVRGLCRRALDRELGELHRRGTTTVVIEPRDQVLAHMSNDFMCEDALGDIVRCAFLETGEQILRDRDLASLRAPARHAAA